MRKSILLSLVFLLGGFLALQAQSLKPIPNDPDVRYGKLSNGLTYYIRHNKYPEKRADFYIAQKVGSMQEEDAQRGLAHFLEHMAFNGTKHFPGRKTMLNYLESIGAQFGSNVNAYTSFDETVYTLSNIPVVRQVVIDSTLLILHDWSSYLSLENDEIDKERPIIKEEWRTRSSAQSRIWDALFPVVYKGSKYAERMPIGTMEVVENFKYDELKEYYKKWYRPDLQAIIVVGDIDAEKVEKQVIDLFSKIPMPANAAERIYYPVEDNEEPIVAIAKDVEGRNSIIRYMIKANSKDVDTKLSEEGFKESTALRLASMMLSDRLSDIAKGDDAALLYSASYFGSYYVSDTKDAWNTIGVSKEGRELETIKILLREVQRMKLYGFTDTELERAKANLISGYEQAFNNKDKNLNNTYTQQYVKHFTKAEPIPSLDYEFDLVKRILNELSSQQINQLMAKIITDKNNVISIEAPEKDSLVLPTVAQVVSAFNEVKSEKIDPYMEEVITEPLMSEVPKAGSIVKEEVDKKRNITKWTLSNGAKVVFYPTELKNDEILMSSMGYGGYSWIEDKDLTNASLIGDIVEIGGLGNFDASQLEKVLAGKNASTSVSFSTYTQGINGRSSIKDFETLMQLTYLTFTAPRKDAKYFENIRSMIITQIENQKKNPNYYFGNNISFAKYGYNPRFLPKTESDIKALNYDRTIELYKQAFANVGSFTFTFVGNINPKDVKSLIETYIASLPTGNKDAKVTDRDLNERRGEVSFVFDQTMLTPKTSVYVQKLMDLEFNPKNSLEVKAFKDLLDIVYVRTIRESEGGTYGVSTGATISREKNESALRIVFDTNPDKIKEISPIVYSEITKIANGEVLPEEFNKVKEFLLKKYQEDIKQNGYWLNNISSEFFYGNQLGTITQEGINALTKDDIVKVAKAFVSQGNNLEVIMNPLK